MKLECMKCDNKRMYIEITVNKKTGESRKGLYCGKCGMLQKWLNKEEFNQCRENKVKIIKR